MIPILETNTFLKDGKPFPIDKRFYRATLSSDRFAQIALYLHDTTTEGNLTLFNFRGRWSSSQSVESPLNKVSGIAFDIDVYITVALNSTDMRVLSNGELRSNGMTILLSDTEKIKDFTAKCSVNDNEVREWFKTVFRDHGSVIFTRWYKPNY